MGYPRVMHAVRFVEGSGFEMKCGWCKQFISLVEDEWVPDHGLSRCKSCWREYKRMHEAGRSRDEIIHELKKTQARLRYRLDRETHLAANRAWRERNRAKVAAYNKRYREQHRDELRAKRMQYDAECRDAILFKKREAYIEKKIRDAAA